MTLGQHLNILSNLSCSYPQYSFLLDFTLGTGMLMILATYDSNTKKKCNGSLLPQK